MCYGNITQLGQKDWEHRHDGIVEILNEVARVGLTEV